MLFHPKGKKREQMLRIMTAASGMGLGLLLLKYLPMNIWGNDILFDASQHVVVTILALYILWFFIDQNKEWRLPFFIFATALTSVISVERIIVGEHNEVGVLLGLLVSSTAILVAEWGSVKDKISF